MGRVRRGLGKAGLVVLATAVVLTIDACAVHTATVVEHAVPQPLATPPTAPPPQPAPARSLIPSSGAIPRTAVPLPEPVMIPTDSYAPEPIVWYGSMEIPKIGLVHDLYEGVTLNNIDQGPSHWTGTAEPGSQGNAVFAGHRVTNSHPFLRINELQPGDEIIFHVRGVRTVYTVVNSLVVAPTTPGSPTRRPRKWPPSTLATRPGRPPSATSCRPSSPRPDPTFDLGAAKAPFRRTPPAERAAFGGAHGSSAAPPTV